MKNNEIANLLAQLEVEYKKKSFALRAVYLKKKNALKVVRDLAKNAKPMPEEMVVSSRHSRSYSQSSLSNGKHSSSIILPASLTDRIKKGAKELNGEYTIKELAEYIGESDRKTIVGTILLRLARSGTKKIKITHEGGAPGDPFRFKNE